MNSTSAMDRPEPGGVGSTATLMEFTDAQLTEVSPEPSLVKEAIRRAPSWLRETREGVGQQSATDLNTVALAACLLDQADVLLALGRHAEALAKASEAESLYQQCGVPARVADCLHVAAEIHRALGDHQKSLECLRKEEEIRRRFAA